MRILDYFIKQEKEDNFHINWDKLEIKFNTTK